MRCIIHPCRNMILQLIRHRDRPNALGRLRRGDDLLAIQVLIVLVDPQRLLLQINVLRHQRQQLALPNPGIVQRHVDCVPDRLVFDGLNKLLEFFLRPEEHLIRLLLAHSARFVTGILLQPVILYRVVENRGHLILHSAQISLAVRLPLFIPMNSTKFSASTITGQHRTPINVYLAAGGRNLRAEGYEITVSAHFYTGVPPVSPRALRGPLPDRIRMRQAGRIGGCFRCGHRHPPLRPRAQSPLRRVAAIPGTY